MFFSKSRGETVNENTVKISVYGILANTEGNVLMQKRANTTYANGWWSFPGGHVEAEESVYIALKRELQEECGVKVSADQCSFKLSLVRKPQNGKRYINFFYVVNRWEGVPVILDGKASELSFVSPENLPKQTLPYIQEALQLINKKIIFHESEY